MNRTRAFLLLAASTTLISGCQSAPRMTGEADTMAFGGPSSTDYAQRLWEQMVEHQLAGAHAIYSVPYKGTHPHGAILDTIDTTLEVGGHRGEIIVKRNYGGPGVSKQAVADDPQRWLKAITVMYRREAGYDPQDKDWFWVKYAPDGGVLSNPKGMKLAGRVAKGMAQGCIACHTGAPGGDLVFNSDRFGYR